MFRSVAPYLDEAGIDDPVVCYQGAAVVDPRSGEFLLHEPLELEVAREAIAALLELGLSPNVYVDDQLYVAEETEYSRAYSGFQHLPVTEVGDLLAWLDRAPTKLVAVADPDRLAVVRARARAALRRPRLHHDVPSAPPRARQSRRDEGLGARVRRRRLGLDLAGVVAFGDGENDVELLEVAGFGVAVEGGASAARARSPTGRAPGPRRRASRRSSRQS